MAKKPNRVTEIDVGLAVMQVLAPRPNGEATVRSIKKHLSNHLKLWCCPN